MEQNLRFGLVLGQLAILKPAQFKLKYVIFEGIFLMFSWAKNNLNVFLLNILF